MFNLGFVLTHHGLRDNGYLSRWRQALASYGLFTMINSWLTMFYAKLFTAKKGFRA